MERERIALGREGGIVEGRKGERKRENGEIAWAKERKKKSRKRKFLDLFLLAAGFA